MASGIEFFSLSAVPLFVALWASAMFLWWLLRRNAMRRQDRLGESTSEEMLDELRSAYIQPESIRILTHTEYVPYVFECIRENIDQGFGDKLVRSLIERIDLQRPGPFRTAIFPVEVEGHPSDLRLLWQRDASDRIDLHIEALPTVIRALREHRKTIPRSVSPGAGH